MNVSQVTLDTIARRRMEIRMRRVSDTILLLWQGRTFELAGLAVDIWRHLDGTLSVDTVIRRLAAQYDDVDRAEVQSDVMETVEKLVEADVVEIMRP